MFLILPTQLYDVKLLKKMRPKITKIIMWEHPQYFTKYNYNIKKLILHRASMRAYLKELKRAKFAVDYYPYDEEPACLSNAAYRLWDPIDKLKLPGRPDFIESPNFLLSAPDYAEYYGRVKKRMVFNNFYIWGKNKLKLFPELRSLDKQNRNAFNGRPPRPPNAPTRKRREVKEAEAYIMARFKRNIGRPDGFNYPITRTAALKSLKIFIKTKFNNFGPYQDFVNKTNPIMYHSVLSSSLNIGLLCPADIIKAISKVRRRIAANSFEGFVRQLFWREYQRLCYIHVDYKKYKHKNKGLLTSAWYRGTLGVEPIDDLIKSGIELGYMHHIGRLMFVGNFMNLSGISPLESFKWFMEFAIDSYEWVMYQNVYDMVFYITRGHTTTRPYACSSKYALRMSNYKRGEWCNKWDALYRKSKLS